MLNRLARHVAGERVVTKLAQTVRQAFDRDRAKESQDVEGVFVLQPFRLSFPAPIGELMQLATGSALGPATRTSNSRRSSSSSAFKRMTEWSIGSPSRPRTRRPARSP